MPTFEQITVILKSLLNITLISEIIPLIFCIFFYKKVVYKKLKVFFVYAISQAIFSVVCYIIIYYSNSFSNYIFILRVHLIVEYLIISLFLFNIFNNRVIKNIIILLLPFFILYNIIDFVEFGNSKFGSLPTLIEFIIFIVFIIFYFFERMRSNDYVFIYNKTHFWIFVGLFVYFSGNFFYILLIEYSKKYATSDIKNQLTIIYCIVTITKNLFLGFSLFASEEQVGESRDEILYPKDLNLDTFTPNNIN